MIRSRFFEANSAAKYDKVNLNAATDAPLKATLLKLTLVFTLVTPAAVHAENLLETYELALKNDATWAANRSKYRADKESVNQARSGLLPRAALTAGYAQTEYEGNSLNTEGLFSESDVSRCNEFNAAVQGLGPGQGLGDISDVASSFGGCAGILSSLTNINSTTRTQDYSATRYGVNVVQPLFRMDRWYTYKQAKKLQNSSHAELAHAQQELMIRVAEAYFGVLRGQEELRIAQNEEKSIKGQLEGIKERFKLGLMRDTDLFEAQASFDIARAARIRAEGELDNVKESLRSLTHQPSIMVTPLPEDLPITPPQPSDTEEWVNFAQQHNYRVIAGQYAVDSAQANKRSKSSGHLPTVDLYFDHTKNDVGGGFTPSSTSTALGINLNVPLYSGGFVSSQTKQAKYQIDEAKNNLVALRRATAMETRQYHRRVNMDVAAINAHERAIRSNNSSLESMRLGYDEGVRSLTDVMATQRRVFAAKRDFANARFDYILNTLRLKKAAGLLSAQDLDVLNGWLQNTTLSPTSGSFNLDIEDSDAEKIGPLKPNPRPYKPKPGAKSLMEAIKNWQSED